MATPLFISYCKVPQIEVLTVERWPPQYLPFESFGALGWNPCPKKLFLIVFFGGGPTLCPERESNPHQGLRRALLYPLSYRGVLCQATERQSVYTYIMCSSGHVHRIFSVGGCSRIRTCDRWLKRPLLYQLSYTPGFIAKKRYLGTRVDCNKKGRVSQSPSNAFDGD